MSQKVAIVVQRYGPKVVGGGELLTREVAEHLHTMLGWDIDVYTTTAQDYMTWANVFPAGEEVINGVRVLRFNSSLQRFKYFGLYDRLTAKLLRRLRRHSATRFLALILEMIWIWLQGPYCPALIQALDNNAEKYRKIIFVTYLYYPTLAGIKKHRDKAILIPLAHDEHAFHFTIVEQMLRSVPSMITNTPPETQLIKSKLGRATPVIDQAGVGFNADAYIPESRKSGDQPYILYLGRISAGKGVAQLVDWFNRLDSDPRFAGLKLRLAGHLEDSVKIPNNPRFEYLGYVDEKTKLQLMQNATVLVNPSAHESLSLIVIEAFALKIPVLVNKHCEVLHHYTKVVKTAFEFGDQVSFADNLHQIIATDWQSHAHQVDLEESRQWALDTFSWQRIASVYQKHVAL